MYMNFYNTLFGQALYEKNELYVADVIQSMISENRKVFMNGLGNNQETIVLGSPQEYGIEIARKTLGAK